MIAVTVNVPDSLLAAAKQAAEKDGTTVEHLMILALAEKLSALLTEEYFMERAKRGDRAKFEAVLKKVPNVPPEDYDRPD